MPDPVLGHYRHELINIVISHTDDHILTHDLAYLHSGDIVRIGMHRFEYVIWCDDTENFIILVNDNERPNAIGKELRQDINEQIILVNGYNPRTLFGENILCFHSDHSFAEIKSVTALSSPPSCPAHYRTTGKKLRAKTENARKTVPIGANVISPTSNCSSGSLKYIKMISLR